MTGMVHFRCSVSWNKVKRMKEPYIQWLHKAKKYLNLAKFKSATLVVYGFLVGAHPGHLCWKRASSQAAVTWGLPIPTLFPDDFCPQGLQQRSRALFIPSSGSGNFCKASQKTERGFLFSAQTKRRSSSLSLHGTIPVCTYTTVKGVASSQNISSLQRSMLNSVITWRSFMFKIFRTFVTKSAPAVVHWWGAS